MSRFSPPTVLTETHYLAQFSCGKPALDQFLKEHALGRQKAMLSRTYVVTLAESQVVVAYFTLAFISVLSAEAPKKTGRGMPSSIPAILLARLAVDEGQQGMRLGSSLFSDALRRSWMVMQGESAPVRFFVVDAKDSEAKAFYESKRMIPSPIEPMRLFLSYKDVQSLFE